MLWMPLLHCVDCWYNPAVFFRENWPFGQNRSGIRFGTIHTRYRIQGVFFGKIAVGVVAV